MSERRRKEGRKGKVQEERPRKPRPSRAQRESQWQRRVVYGTIVVVVAVVAILGAGVVNNLWLAPNRVVATVNGDEIRMAEFQNRLRFDTYFAMLQGFNPFEDTQAAPTTGQPRISESFAQTILDRMIEDKLIEQQAEELGVSITDAEVEKQLELSFGFDAGDPEPTGTPFPTPLPTGDVEPTVTSTYVFTPTPTLTPTVDPENTPIPTLTPTVEPTITPTPSSPPTETPEPTDAPTQVPITEEEYVDNRDVYVEQISAQLNMSEDAVMELIRNQIRSDLLGRRVEEALDLPVSEETSRVHAAHILVATDQEIAVARARIVGDGEPFEVVAAEVSLDSNAFKGGDLGWFTEETMVAEFSEVAFSTPVGEVSLPVQTQFGWHIIKVYDKVTEPATSTTIRQRKAQAFQEWRTGLLEEADISQPDSLAGFIPDFAIPPQLLGS